MDSLQFSSLQLKPALLENVDSLGYHTMTPIQATSLPAILNQQDVIAQAKTGSGKTATFGLGLLQALQENDFSIQSLVLCPTRELADQVAKAIRQLARQMPNIKVLTLCGGTPFEPQVSSLEHGAHIVVGTPGRIEDHLRKGHLNVKKLTTLVLDEADRMLEMGFQDTLDEIVNQLPKSRQTLLFSATFPEEIQNIAKRVMQNPKHIKVADAHDEHSIEQHFYKVENDADRYDALVRLLMHVRPESALVFCHTKLDTETVAEALVDDGFVAMALNGDLDQKMRDQTFVRFANKSISVLVATDVAARGLDVDALDMVVNYQLANDAETHTHRIGRTGRAGQKGRACTLFSKKEQFKIDQLAEHMGVSLKTTPLPNVHASVRGFKPLMQTLMIDGGKNKKFRPGDVLGALTGKQGIEGKAVGKIDVFNNRTFVAVHKKHAAAAFTKLNQGKLKGRSVRVRKL